MLGATAAASARRASCAPGVMRSSRLGRAKAEMNNPEVRKNIEGAIFLVLFCLTVPAANWMIQHVGTACMPAGPCVVPVAPGLMAPSGVLMIGLALVLRDLVQRRLGME